MKKSEEYRQKKVALLREADKTTNNPAARREELRAQAEAFGSLERLADMSERGIHITTNSGLVKVGSASPEANSTVAAAHNATVDQLEEQIAALTARVAALEAKLAS